MALYYNIIVSFSGNILTDSKTQGLSFVAGKSNMVFFCFTSMQGRRKPKVSQLKNGTLDSLKISTISLASSSLVAERGQEIRFPGKEMQSIDVYSHRQLCLEYKAGAFQKSELTG